MGSPKAAEIQTSAHRAPEVGLLRRIYWQKNCLYSPMRFKSYVPEILALLFTIIISILIISIVIATNVSILTMTISGSITITLDAKNPAGHYVPCTLGIAVL